jgi:hypothetical protein
VVPRVMVAGNGEQGSSGNVMEALLTMMLSDRFSALSSETTAAQERSPEAQSMRQQIYDSMKKKPASGESTEKSKK